LASHVNFNERELRGDPPPTNKKKKFKRGVNSTFVTNSTFTNSSVLPTTSTTTSTAATSNVDAITNTDANNGNSMQIVKLSALKSTKHASFGTTSSGSVPLGAKQNNTFTSEMMTTTGSHTGTMVCF